MQDLPTTLPVFNLRSTILMPHAQLPMQFTGDDFTFISSEAVENNIVAVVQPRPVFTKKETSKSMSSSYGYGCAGKIADIYTTGNIININIYGLCRFEVVNRLPQDSHGIERIVVDYTKYLIDMEQDDIQNEYDKTRLLSALDLYFKRLDISPNWKEIEQTPADILISALAMACPFHPSEKQSLLETVDFKERTDMMIRMFEINSYDRYNTVNTVN